MNKVTLKISIIALAFSLLAFKTLKKTVAVWMIGDSTMCNYAASRAPLTGWGMPFAKFFDSSVEIRNRAMGGRSTRTFISENRWKPIADSLQAGDVVLIQFGHNDEATEEKYKDRYTPVAAYQQNLAAFILDARKKGAIPVLITPVSRMKFDAQGNALETHEAYSRACEAVARQYKTALVDLDKESRKLFQQLGPQGSKLLFMQLEPGVNPVYPKGLQDNTHFNELGARKMAEIVLRELKNNQLEVTNSIVKPNSK